MNEERLKRLVESNDGFEICLGFIDDEDHYVGGKGNEVWYYMQKGPKEEFYLGALKDGKWEDRHYVKKKKDFVEEAAESGSTLKMVLDRLYFGQEHIEMDGRKPTVIEKDGKKIDHYSYGFGEIAYEIMEEYGVTISYSNINDVSVGFRMRRIDVGEYAAPPKH